MKRWAWIVVGPSVVEWVVHTMPAIWPVLAPVIKVRDAIRAFAWPPYGLWMVAVFASQLTFPGLRTGVSGMRFAFGPAAFFLFADRWMRLHPGEEPA